MPETDVNLSSETPSPTGFRINKTAVLAFFLTVLLIILGFVAWRIRNPGTSTVQTPKLAAGFPEIPVYPGANLISSASEPKAGGTFYQSTWEVNAGVPDISVWYLRSLPDSGWMIDVKPADINVDDIQNIISVKEDKTLNLGIIKEADGNSVKITAEFFPPVKDEEVIEETVAP